MTKTPPDFAATQLAPTRTSALDEAASAKPVKPVFMDRLVQAHTAGFQALEARAAAERALVESANKKAPEALVTSHMKLRRDLALQFMEELIANTNGQPVAKVSQAISEAVQNGLPALEKNNKTGGGTARRLAGAYIAALVDGLATRDTAVPPVERETFRRLKASVTETLTQGKGTRSPS